ncbi:MAG: PQQ-binding-like beta-propeller repeat protein [Anaerolineae bacterium]|nr:PQQ-binding-like beta-propeller repeat protein [Anaerolineae bacterium]
MRITRFALVIFALVMLLSVPAQAQSPTPSASTFDIPPEIAGHEKEWPLANHDYANTRAAVGSSINASNVSQLQVAWTSPLKGTSEWGGGTGAPIIVDGVVYFQDLGANAYAVNLQTGKTIWEKEYHNQIFGPSGPGIGYGKLIVMSRIDRFSALDLKTGQEQWQFVTGTASPAGAFQPSVFDHTVYAAMQAASSGHGTIIFHSYQGGSSGAAVILDINTGKEKWRWQAVEEGFWGNPKVNSGGGLWFPPAIDTNTGVSYWGTGNPSPVPGIKGYPNGSSRPGPNLYTNSLVALDHRSGKMLWYNQVRPHDLFNLDFQISPMLATVKLNNQDRQIVIGSGKDGRVFGFDAQTGKTLWMKPIGLHQNDDLTAVPEGQTVWVAPGAWGGVEAPMAYADRMVYALTANLPSPYHATAYDAETPEEALNRSEGGTTYKNGTADLVALDAATGEIKWQLHIDRPAFGGVTVVNDLVFTATLDGIIYAVARQDGRVVWQHQAPGGTNAWPAVAGDTLIWPIGLGGSPAVIAWRLNGKGSIPTPNQLRTPVLTPEGR